MSFVRSISIGRVLRYKPLVFNKPIRRTYLSSEYYCGENWNARLTSPVLQKVNLDDFYHELDLSYQKYKNISAIDVDIFVNTVEDDGHTEEMLDLVHKLRLSADTGRSLESTAHSVIRHLLNQKDYDRLVQVLDDRLNYGVFLDFYTANLILDTCWKNKNFCIGTKIACQLMLQEDFSHPVTLYLSLMHCYKYLASKENKWVVEPVQNDDNGEEVKIRVKFVDNPFFDDHFDLREPNHLIGKTLWFAGSINNDPLSKTFQLIGLELYGKHDRAKELLEKLKDGKIYKEGLELLPEDNTIRKLAQNLNLVDDSIESFLNNKIQDAVIKTKDEDIEEQHKLYEKWNLKRVEVLEMQRKKQETVQRLEAIEEQEKKLREKEMKLWFFENEEKLELDIEAKKVYYPKRWFGKKKKPRKVDESYVPPEVKTSYKTSS